MRPTLPIARIAIRCKENRGVHAPNGDLPPNGRERLQNRPQKIGRPTAGIPLTGIRVAAPGPLGAFLG
jgi:hypothetical protein